MSDMDAEGIPDLETPINQDEGLIPPRDHPQGVEEFGITAAEERGDEPLADRVLREEPDFDEGDVARAADDAIEGQLVDAGSADVEGLDDEKDVVATEVSGDDERIAPSAEEAAMHITDSP
jgi:hypothetical protein